MSARRLPALLTRVFLLAFFALVLTGLFVTYPFPSWLVFLPLVLAWVAGIAGGRLASRDLKAARRDAVEVLPPVAGRWSAINSPADRVPSHGVHTYGQTYAIDIVAEKQERQERQAGQEGQGGQDAEGAAEGAAERPAFAWLWPLARRPEAFPAFGAPLFAVADAKVVTAVDTQRDHLSRNSCWGSPTSCSRRASCADWRAPTGSSATASCSTSATVRTRRTPTSDAAPPGAHRRHGPGGAADRPLRELRQLHRAACALPADGPPGPRPGPRDPVQVAGHRRAGQRRGVHGGGRGQPWLRQPSARPKARSARLRQSSARPRGTVGPAG